MLSQLRFPGVVHFYGISHNLGTTYIVTEFCPITLSDVVEALNNEAFSKIAEEVRIYLRRVTDLNQPYPLTIPDDRF